MILSKKFALIGTSIVILALLIVVLFGSINNLFAGSNYSQQQIAVRDLAVQSFNINKDKVKTLFADDVFDDKIAKENTQIRGKLGAALNELSNEKIFVIGDHRPVFFLEGNNKASIAIKHADGTISLTDFDISKDKPVKIDHKVKEVKQ